MVCEVKLGSHILQIDRQLLLGGKRVSVGPRALAILSILARRRGEIVTKDELHDEIWPNIVVEENTLHVHVAALRKALGSDAHLVETVRSVGYVLHGEDLEPQHSRPEPAASTGPIAPAEKNIGENASKTGRNVLAALLLFAGFALLAFVGTQIANRESAQIALMPFESASGDPQEVALAGGITEELIFRLRRIDGLEVSTIAGDASPTGKVVKGRLQSDGEQIRLAVRLEDTKGEVLWSEMFDSDIDQLFNVQEEIARNVAGVLSVSLKVGAESRSYGGTDDPEAYVNYLRGRVNRQNQDRQIPTSYLERALALDPDYPKALTEATFVDGISLYLPMPQSEADQLMSRMDRLSSHALKVAPNFWQSHAARGWYVLLERDFVSADAFHASVERLDPGNDPELLNVLANYHWQLGRIRRSAKFRRAKAMIDPIFPASEMPRYVLYRGEFEKVIEMYNQRESGYLVDGDAYIPITLFWALRLSGRQEEARKLAIESFADFEEAEPLIKMDYGANFPDLPYRELKFWAREQFGSGGRSILAGMAQIASEKGNHRLAMDYLRLAYGDRVAMGGYYILWHPALSNTRATPEFAQWIEELGMVDAWRASGDWGDFCAPVNDTEIACR